VPLAPCPACGASLSDRAPACPRCGHPLAPAPRGQLAAIMVLVIVGSLLVFGAALLFVSWDDVVVIIRHLAGR
jgi:uncharacterized protein (DUF983 family)